MSLTSVEICAGAGGQAIGLAQAGFKHHALLELDPNACHTLRRNRPDWNTLQLDVTKWHATEYRGKVDLFAGGVPCPPFSKAGKQLGAMDERDLFPTAVRLIRECLPKAVMLENVRGLLDPQFDEYRRHLERELAGVDGGGYVVSWKLLHASDYGVPQLRPRTLLVALREDVATHFTWPSPNRTPPLTVGEALGQMMGEGGWEGAREWAAAANTVAPTLVGGSHKHGGPDLGPTRARKAWARLGVDGRRVAALPPGPDHVGMPYLSVEMAGIIQGFPPEWRFMGYRTHAYRQIGNAFPPPVARAVGLQIAKALRGAARVRSVAADVAAAEAA